MNPKLPIAEKLSSSHIHFFESNDRSATTIYVCTLIALFFIIVTFVIRLFQLTVVQGAYYRGLADGNRTRELFLEARRGSILDRKGFALATSEKSETASESATGFGKRTYSLSEAASVIVGFRQIADKTDITDDPCIVKLIPNQKVGKKGVEKLFECLLRGKPGKKLIEVNAIGKDLKTLSFEEPVDGKNVILAIDGRLQELSEALLVGKRGSIVVLNVHTGEVLALATSPTYSSQAFEDADSTLIKEYLTDEDKPLFDRAIEGQYPPGSTFKLAVAAAALEEKVVSGTTEFLDEGFIKVGQHEFGNWFFREQGKTDGQVALVEGLQRSNDIYFYRIGALLGAEKLQKWAEHFGFGRKTNIGLNESEGTVPGPFWKREVLKEDWYLGDTYNTSIGQGYMEATPIQVALMTQAIANGGSVCEPRLLKVTYENPIESQEEGGFSLRSPKCKKLSLSSETLRLLHEGMQKACETGGTAYPFFNYAVYDSSASASLATVSASLWASASAKLPTPKIPMKVACKTGTAEIHAQTKLPHAWFTMYAPLEDPEIAIVAMVEEGGQGSEVAAPLAKQVATMYFANKEQ